MKYITITSHLTNEENTCNAYCLSLWGFPPQIFYMITDAPDTEIRECIEEVNEMRMVFESILDKKEEDLLGFADSTYRDSYSMKWKKPERKNQIRQFIKDRFPQYIFKFGTESDLRLKGLSLYD